MEPHEVHARRGELTIVDVRERDEWEAGQIRGAKHIPLAELPRRLAELDHGPIAVVCRSGSRSLMATRLLLAQGFDAYNMEGGLQAWERAGLPLVTSNGQEARVI